MIKTLLIDPPWRMCSGGKSSINVHYQYDLQTQEEIKETVDGWLQDVAVNPEAHVYIWCINSFKTGGCRGILDAVDLCEHIGFRAITLLPWIKTNIGNPTPYGMRAVEHYLAPRTVHSKKPDGFYAYIEKRSQGPYCELYARNRREGWISFGNEVDRPLPKQQQQKTTTDQYGLWGIV